MSNTPQPSNDSKPLYRATLSGGELLVTFAGKWDSGADLPEPGEAQKLLGASPRPDTLRFDASGLGAWDSRFVVFCRFLLALARLNGVVADLSGLPDGTSGLDMAEKMHEREGTAVSKAPEPFLSRVGGWGIHAWQGMYDFLEFVGDVTLAFFKLIRGKAVFKASGLALLLQQVGLNALPIVSLINFLVGLILAFVASTQLLQFGAQIYVSTIVGIAMVRVMSAIMTGIIMAGRTGAAFAAELGAMQFHEEIDAFRTFGISPIEFLVMPRMLALVLTMPLLCVYADVVGVLGGFVVGVAMLGINPELYVVQTYHSIPLANFVIGLAQSVVSGILVALAGCYYGMRCGRSTMAVGKATTSAMVAGILSIVVATAVITWLCNLLGW